MIDEIKNRIGIVDLVGKLGLRVNPSGFILSIYKEEKTPSLKLYPKTNTFFCFATNQGGDIIKFYQDYCNITIKEVIKELAAICGLNNSSTALIHSKRDASKDLIHAQKKSTFFELLESEKEYFEERSAIIEHESNLSKDQAEAITYQLIKEQREEIQKRVYKELYDFCMAEGIEESILNYLTGKERGLKLSAIKFFKLFSVHSAKRTIEFLKSVFTKDELILSGLFTSKDFFVFTYHRVVIPYLANDEIKYLRGRYFYKNSPLPNSFGKYIGLTNFAGNLTAKRVYNIDILKFLSPHMDLIISEGEFDCMILNQQGMNAIAIPGVSNFPKEIIPLLNNFNIYLCFDNDAAGTKAIDEISSLFDKPIKQIKLKNFKDISELVNNEHSE